MKKAKSYSTMKSGSLASKLIDAMGRVNLHTLFSMLLVTLGLIAASAHFDQSWVAYLRAVLLAVFVVTLMYTALFLGLFIIVDYGKTTECISVQIPPDEREEPPQTSDEGDPAPDASSHDSKSAS